MPASFGHKVLLFISLVIAISFKLYAEEPAAATSHEPSSTIAADEVEGKEKEAQQEKNFGFNVGEMIMGHILDSHEWHFYDFKRSDGTVVHGILPLPVIVYSAGKGLRMFSSARLEHGESYDGFKLNEETGKIEAEDGAAVYDISLTKNVVQMFIAVALMLLLFLSVARNYKKYGTGAPRKMQSAVEVIVLFVRDQVAKPMLGDKTNKFLPYLLTIFFFIWINNIIGLFPGSANVTGNIAFTGLLALFTFVLMMISSTRHFWSHLVAPREVPVGVWPILVPIEIISNIIVKPMALMIRLFANMLAGHLIVLSFLALIFIFASMNIAAGLGVSVFSVAFAVFIYFLELLVAALQAYIFTILSALFIGECAVGGHHEEHHYSK